MIRTIALFCLVLSFPLLIQAAPVVAFVDVNVIPMDKERILPHQTVIPEVYEAIVDESGKQNIRVVGHADSLSVGLARALKAKQQIEHLDSYLEAARLCAKSPRSRSALCNLCVLCVSVVCFARNSSTTETQRTQRLHREERRLDCQGKAIRRSLTVKCLCDSP